MENRRNKMKINLNALDAWDESLYFVQGGDISGWSRYCQQFGGLYVWHITAI